MRRVKIRRIVVCGVALIGAVVALSLLRDHLLAASCEEDGGRWNPMDARCERPLQR